MSLILKMAKKLSELRYGGIVVAFAPDPQTLLLEKCEMVLNRSVRYPELLEVYFQGREKWLFDEKIITSKRASSILHEGFPYA